MENFIKPKMEIICFNNNDIMTSSGCAGDCIVICDDQCETVCQQN